MSDLIALEATTRGPDYALLRLPPRRSLLPRQDSRQFFRLIFSTSSNQPSPCVPASFEVMIPFHSALPLALLSQILLVFAQDQTPLSDVLCDSSSRPHAESIAVIGAGISGAVFAFDLPQYHHVTVFEREDRVGGRIKSVPLHPRHKAEAGSLDFHTEDWCVNEAIRDTALTVERRSWPSRWPQTTGVWDGSNLWGIPACAVEPPSWKDTLRYGLSPWIWQRMVKRMSNNWNLFARNADIQNLTSELKTHNMEQPASQSASEYLDSTWISRKYLSDVIVPCTRKRLLRPLSEIHGLAALMAGQELPAGPVSDGNVRLVERLFELSESRLRLSTPVLGIGPGSFRRYRLTYSTPAPPETGGTPPDLIVSQEFENVIIATPLHTANLNLEDLGISNLTSNTNYSDIHVTSFLTPATLSPSFFGLLNTTVLPNEILSTAHGQSTSDLYSISWSWHEWVDLRFCWGAPILCDTVIGENLYRIESRRQMEDWEIVSMIGGQYKNHTPLLEQGITWVHRQPWISAIAIRRPITKPLPQHELAPGLFYLGAAEEILSSMEMGCRMAKSAAARFAQE